VTARVRGWCVRFVSAPCGNELVANASGPGDFAQTGGIPSLETNNIAICDE